jgi:hypothetical protein
MYRRILAISVLFLSCLVGAAKDKKKLLLPPDVLQAQTVMVVIDPDAGMDVQNPNANQTAQVDVENALMKWDRFSLVTDPAAADLIITVRKGSSKIVQPTIGGLPNNNRPVGLGSPGSGGRVGSRQGAPGDISDPSDPQSDPQSPSSSPQPQLEVGRSQDILVVYRGSKNDSHDAPLDTPPVWRYTAKDALQSPGVPAVDAFRKLIADSEKQQAGKH